MSRGRSSRRGRERERESSRLPVEQEARCGAHLGPWDHDLSQRQILNRLSHPGTPTAHSLKGTVSMLGQT